MKFIVKVEVEVVDTESVSEGKKAAYDLAATLNASKRGRRAAGAQASVVGITVEEDRWKLPSCIPVGPCEIIPQTHATDGSECSTPGIRAE